MIENFVYSLVFISTSRKNFRPQTSDDETDLAEEADYVWSHECSHTLLIIIPIDISIRAMTTVSLQKDYVRVTPPTIDATPLNYNTMFNDRTGNCSNSFFINP